MENNESTQNKYDAALAKYNTNLNDAEVAAEVAKIIEEKVPANNTPEVKKFLFNCIDLTCNRVDTKLGTLLMCEAFDIGEFGVG